MFGRLMPKEGKYFDLFNAHADLIAEGGGELSALINALVDTPERPRLMPIGSIASSARPTRSRTIRSLNCTLPSSRRSTGMKSIP